MKQHYIFLLLFFSMMANAQIVNIPDANFKAKLLAATASNCLAFDSNGMCVKIDSNNDLQIQVSEALAITKLKVYYGGISDLTGIEAFANLETFACYDNQISIIDLSGLTMLKELDCRNNLLTAIDISPSPVEILNCSDNNISQLNISSNYLTSLTCNDNNLTAVNLGTMPNLIYLECYNNPFVSLAFTQNNNLITLKCGNPAMTSLNLSGCSDLETLFCKNSAMTQLNVSNLPMLRYIATDNNPFTTINTSGSPNIGGIECINSQLTNLDVSGLPLLDNLNVNNNLLTDINMAGLDIVYLSCKNNQLTNLNLSNFPNLRRLWCSSNQITGIMDLTTAPLLEQIECDHNLLTSLILPNFAYYHTINCSYNLLTELNIAGFSSNYIYCSNNQIASLNFSGCNTYSIDCSNNMLTTLDCSGLTLNSLIATNNNLQSLYIMNVPSVSQFNFNYNPGIKYICVTASKINQILNKLNSYGVTGCEVNSYCTYTPGAFYDIKGTAKFDSDSNGCDNNDFVYPNLKFNITNGSVNGTIISDASGNWNIPVQAGTHTITPLLENSSYFNISPASLTVSFPDENAPYSQNFCITPTANHPDIEVSVFNANTAIPGFDANYRIRYKNKGTTVASGFISFSFDDAVSDFISADPVTDSQAAGQLSWNYSNLLPFETRTITFSLNLNSPVETPPLNQGDVLHFTTNAALSGDENPADNVTILNQNVFNALDPNDKTCLEGDTITPEMVGEYVHYKIRFENTGNYYAAIVTVKDVIDTSKFDISTLTPIAGSHPFITRIINTNQVEFVFDNIMLPFDDANNDGYVIFKIKTKPTLVLGDELSNTAGIYFNYNAPVITNTAITTVATPLNTNENDNVFGFALYPNPVKNVLNISSKTNAEIDSMEIYNMLGQEIMRVLPAVGEQSIDVSQLSGGQYIVRVISGKTSWNAKFIKE